MAELNNNNGNKIQKKIYATDEEGMLKDAKEYASRDFSQTLEVIRLLGVDKNKATDEMIAKALIITKLKHIKNSRLSRIDFFD